MPFRNRNFLRPVQSLKHVVDVQSAVAAAVSEAKTMVVASDTPDLAGVTEVQTGAHVKAIYLNIEAYATSSGGLSNFYLIIFKNPGGNLVVPEPNVVGASDNKKYVIHQEMVMLQKEPTADALGGNPRVVFKGVIRIPRLYQRFGYNDLLQTKVLAPGVSVEYCIECIYKEFR